MKRQASDNTVIAQQVGRHCSCKNQTRPFSHWDDFLDMMKLLVVLDFFGIEHK